MTSDVLAAFECRMYRVSDLSKSPLPSKRDWNVHPTLGRDGKWNWISWISTPMEIQEHQRGTVIFGTVSDKKGFSCLASLSRFGAFESSCFLLGGGIFI